MSTLSQIKKIKELYDQGENLMQHMRSTNNGANDVETIMISYDFQAGSYIKNAEDNREYFEKYTSAIKSVIDRYGTFDSIMEVGVGEATVMTPLMKKLIAENASLNMFGFDISWSRIHFARKYSSEQGVSINLFTGNLFNIPLPDNSIDVVYTSHSLEPNGGKEAEALRELYRVAAKYVVLLEPSYEFASEAGRQRMGKHGYIKNINKHAEALGFNVVEHRLFDHFINPLNPTALTVIEKNAVETNDPKYNCPISKTELMLLKGSYYSNESFLVYPIVDGIPCLLTDNAILAAHYNS